jgi:hypothetical protein
MARLLAQTVAAVAQPHMSKARRQNNIRANGDAHGEPLRLKLLPPTLLRMSKAGLCAHFNNKRDERSIRFVQHKKPSWREAGTKADFEMVLPGGRKSPECVRLWPMADIPSCIAMSAFGGKASMANRTANVIDGSLWRRNSGADKGRKPNTHARVIGISPDGGNGLMELMLLIMAT